MKENINEIKDNIALFRYEVILPLLATPGNFKSDKAFFSERSKEEFRYVDGRTLKISTTTIERWYYQYKKKGFEGLKPQKRSDIGKRRKVDGDIVDRVFNLKKTYPRMPSTAIWKKLYADGITGISLSTVNRLVNDLKRDLKLNSNNEMLRYERGHINEVWCGDSTVIWADSIDKIPKKLYIIALIDDCSRRIVGCDIFDKDNSENLITVIKSAISQYGVPNVFNFDNGRNYKSHQMEIIAAKLGSRIHYCAPYTPTAKAKIERWFRTLKDHWSCNDLKTIDDIRTSLKNYVVTYNQTIHSSLKGMSPLERFNKELNTLRYINDSSLFRAFLFEIDRKVSNDNVIKVKQIDYETPYKYAKQRVKVLYMPDLSHVYILENEGELIEIFKLNKTANSLKKRERLIDLVEEIKND